MKEIRLWQIAKNDGNEATVLSYEGINQTQTEQMLENVLVQSPDLLISGIKLVGRQTDTPGGPLDLLGVDEDGRLVIFELKRGTLTRDAVAQLIDYASFLSELEPDELSVHITERSGKLGIDKIDNFSSWYQEEFAKTLTKAQKPRLILVGLGADDRTRRMISFLAKSDIDISLITFHGFQDGNKLILARQVEVEAKPQISTATVSKESNLEKLRKKIIELNVESFYENLAIFFQKNLSPAYQWPNQGGFSFYLPEITESGSQSSRVYLSLYLYDGKPGKTQIYLHPRAVKAMGDFFDNFKSNLNDSLKLQQDGSGVIWVTSKENWDKIIEHFTEACEKILNGWKSKRELAISNQNITQQPSDST